MHTLSLLDQTYGEAFLTKCLQKQIAFRINEKTIKRGRLLLFRRNHFFIQITLLTDKNIRESFEIPFPLKTEFYEKEGLIYFDYRLNSLNLGINLLVKKKISSSYFDKILEIQSLS
jgi:hypothetical protein